MQNNKPRINQNTFNNQIESDQSIKDKEKTISEKATNQVNIFAKRLSDFYKKRGTISYVANFTKGTRQVNSKWASGTALPDIEELCILSQLFDCEAGYLLGEFDCKKRAVADIQAEIGLSEQAISNLQTLKMSGPEFTGILDRILSSNFLIPFLNSISSYIGEGDMPESVLSLLQNEMVNGISHIDRYSELKSNIEKKVTQKAIIEELMWKMIEEQGEGEK